MDAKALVLDTRALIVRTRHIIAASKAASARSRRHCVYHRWRHAERKYIAYFGTPRIFSRTSNTTRHTTN